VSGSSASSSSTQSSPTKGHDPPPSSRTLPYTGLNVWACALLGVMLLAAGTALRRIVPKSE
jgi:hypothetical protein